MGSFEPKLNQRMKQTQADFDIPLGFRKQSV